MSRNPIYNNSSFKVTFGSDSNFNAEFTNMIFVPEHSYIIGSGLLYDADTNTLSVDVVDDAIDGESRPITSNGVYKELGNISVLLGTI